MNVKFDPILGQLREKDGSQGADGKDGSQGADGISGEPLEDNYIEVSSENVASGNIIISGETAPVGVEIGSAYYDIEGYSRNSSTGNFEIPLAPILAQANLSSLVGTWKVWRAGGKKGDTGDTGGEFSISQVSSLPGTPDASTLYLIG